LGSLPLVATLCNRPSATLRYGEVQSGRGAESHRADRSIYEAEKVSSEVALRDLRKKLKISPQALQIVREWVAK